MHRMRYLLRYVHKYSTFNTMKSSSHSINPHLVNDKLYPTNHPNAIQYARQCLLTGQIIALPTDTVYGLACDANNECAVQNLYTIKGRHFSKPIAICVQNVAALRYYGQAEHLTDAVLNRLLPGPITIVIERSTKLWNRFLNPNTSKIGIRIPNSLFIQKLCAAYNEQPLALTSANRSSEPSTLNVHEFDVLWPSLGGIFDAGQIGETEESRLASTVIDLSIPGYYQMVREGVAYVRTLKIMEDFNIRPYTLVGD